MLPIGGGQLIVAAVPATGTASALLGVESNESNIFTGGLGSVERRDVIQHGSFAVNAFRNLVLDVAAYHHALFAVFVKCRSRFHVEVREPRICSRILGGVECIEDFIA